MTLSILKNNYYEDITIQKLIKKHFGKKVRFNSKVFYLESKDDDEKLKPLLRKYLSEEKKYTPPLPSTLPDITEVKYPPPLPSTLPDITEEKYPESDEEDLDLSSCWNTKELQKALKISIMTNNVDYSRRKHNYPTLGRSEVMKQEEDYLEKWKKECNELMKQKQPCKKLIEKRKDLNKTFKHLDKYGRKIFCKKYNYITSIIKNKYGYKK